MHSNITAPGCSGKPRGFFQRHPTMKFLMRVGVFYISLAVLSTQLLLAHPGRSQTLDSINVTVELRSENLKRLFRQIEKQTGLLFAFQPQQVNMYKQITLSRDTRSVKETLDIALKGTSLGYRQVNNSVVIFAEKEISRETEVEKLVIFVTGTITDQTGNPIPGANILVKGTTVGTTTDANGKYSLEVFEDNAVLIFSFIGYITQELPLNGRTLLDVTLVEDVMNLAEVVVVGYGTEKKVNLTGSISTISSEQIKNIPVGQTSMALQGMAPGVTVTQRSGQPGRDGGIIRIRGLGTLGDNSPLVMVDGVETDLNNVEADAIESISVLKDAASAAIYGARAANGVILITTKRGEKGVSVSYNSYAGFQTPTDLPNIVNATDHMELVNEAHRNIGLSPLWSEAEIEAHRNGMPSDQYPNTDWQALSMKDRAFMQSHNVSVNAGGEKLKLFTALSYMDQEGIIPNTDFKRFNLRVNTDIQVTEKFRGSMDVFLRKTNSTQPPNGTGYIFHWMRRIPSNEVGVLSNGRYGEGWNGDHPLARAKDGGSWDEESLDAILNFKLNYAFTDWLSAEAMYAPRFQNPHETRFFNITQTYARDGVTPTHFVPQRNSLTERFERELYNNFRAVVTLDKTFNTVHNIDVIAGYQQEDQTNNYISAYREVFPLPQYQEINAGNRINERTGGSGSHWALRSYFGRVKYNFDDRYLLEGNIRMDASSRFAGQNRRGVFPSFSVAWRISEESFMENMSGVVDQLKLRASWGQLGNQNIGLYPFAAFVQIGGNSTDYVFNGTISPGAALNNMANPDIRWETSETTDIGLDANLWGKLDVGFDYYYRRTSDILLQLNIPQTLGLVAPFQNSGVVENRGWDFVTTYRNQIRDLNYSITFNLSDVKNKILDMRGVERSGLQVSREGYPINSFYGYEAIGYFQNADEVASHATQFGTIAPGDLKYKDVNSDGMINQQDQSVIGSPIPRYTFGARFNVGYRAFDFSLFLQGVGKADGYLYGQGIQPFYTGGTIHEQHKDRWTPENPDAAYPRLAWNQTNNIQNSNFWMKNAAYLRGQNLQIGYTFSDKLIRNIRSMRIYLGGRNLFTIDNFYEGYDPEAPVSTGGWYPQMKVYTVGLNVNF